MTRLFIIVAWIFRLIPAAALFSFVLADQPGLRWLGVLGLVPLALAFLGGGCAACRLRPGGGDASSPVRIWPGY